MSTHIVIPVRNNVLITMAICEQLKDEEFDKCWIFDNGSTDDTPEYLSALTYADARFFPVRIPDVGIYYLWNDGVERAKAEGADFIAILNNDLILYPGTIKQLTNVLEIDPEVWVTYPDYDYRVSEGRVNNGTRCTSGTYRHGGMSGFCFMLRANKINWSPLVDPQFEWWGGDDDIAFTIQKAGGKQVRLVGWPIDHINEATACHYDLGTQKNKDLKAVIKKWGR